MGENLKSTLCKLPILKYILLSDVLSFTVPAFRDRISIKTFIITPLRLRYKINISFEFTFLNKKNFVGIHGYLDLGVFLQEQD